MALVGGSPTPNHFLFVCAKESNQRKPHPAPMAFSFPARLIKQGVCGTRPYKPYQLRLVAELKQSSTTTPCLIALLGMAKGLKTR